jgi:hypothetical protein
MIKDMASDVRVLLGGPFGSHRRRGARHLGKHGYPGRPQVTVQPRQQDHRIDALLDEGNEVIGSPANLGRVAVSGQVKVKNG